MGIENVSTDLSAKQALLKKANYALEKNGADINDNDTEINANAEKQKTEIAAEAKANAIKIEAEAQAEANKMINDSVTANVIAYM